MSTKPYTPDAEPLLNDDDDGSDDVEMQQVGSSRSGPPTMEHMPPPSSSRRRFLATSSSRYLAGGLALFCVILAAGGFYTLFAPRYSNYRTLDPVNPLDQRFARQSGSLSQARARYALKNNGLSPPPHYDDWFAFAQRGQCLIDDYDQVYADFKPFYQLAQSDPEFFKKALDKAIEVTTKEGLSLRAYEIRRGRFESVGGGGTLYEGDWPRTFKRFARFLPDMKFVLSGQDEPRVLFDYRRPDVQAKALELSDPEPFKHNPHPTDEFFKQDGKCLLTNSKTGFGDLTNDHNAFLLSSATTQFTTDLLPVLSVARISPCFSDILVPSEFYYSDSGWSPKYGKPDDIKWEDKMDKMYWRGATSGGMIVGQNYHEFPRFKLIEIAQNHTDILEVGLSAIPTYANCRNSTECDQSAIEKEYNVGGSKPREEGFKYKYAFDVDGNSFSGRYLGLLRFTNSLVFKSTVFDEYFNDWLRPYEHYIPVLPDLSDLVSKVEWAISHDDEARRIQEAGKELAERLLTDAQNDCYFFAVLLEYARLQSAMPLVRRGWAKRSVDWWRS